MSPAGDGPALRPTSTHQMEGAAPAEIVLCLATYNNAATVR